MGKSKILVRPFVSDTKNCLLFKPEFPISDTILASLQAALKNAIQRVFELEDSEFSRVEHYERLKNLKGSDLEVKWLDFVYNNGHILPTHAQGLIESCHTWPDFLYKDKYTAIYID